MNRARSRASSLVEVLVSLGTFSLALVLLLSLMVFAMQSTRKEDSQGTAQRTLLAVCQKFSREFESTAASSVQLDASNGVDSLQMSFSTYLDASGQAVEEPGTGLSRHQAHLIYSRNAATSQLHRARSPFVPTTEPIALLIPALQAAVTSQPGPTILNGITKFSVLNFEDDSPTVTPARRLKFFFQVTTANGQAVQLKVPVEILGP